MRRLAAGSHLVMPWKNGGGTTTEIARWPEGASLDDFGWRVSLASVAAAGPFSRFAGVDRSIAVVEGGGMVLAIEGRGEATLGPASPPLAFPGEVAVDARLTAGATTDFNAMTRRGSWRHLVTRRRLDAPLRLAPLGDVAVLYVARGSSGALVHGDAVVLDRGDAVDLALGPGGVESEIFVVDLWRV